MEKEQCLILKKKLKTKEIGLMVNLLEINLNIIKYPHLIDVWIILGINNTNI